MTAPSLRPTFICGVNASSSMGVSLLFYVYGGYTHLFSLQSINFPTIPYTIAICTAPDGWVVYPEVTSYNIASDGSNGAIITWEDHRNDDSYDVYAERITVTGTIDVPITEAAVKVVTGLSQNALQIVQWLPSLDDVRTSCAGI